MNMDVRLKRLSQEARSKNLSEYAALLDKHNLTEEQREQVVSVALAEMHGKKL